MSLTMHEFKEQGWDNHDGCHNIPGNVRIARSVTRIGKTRSTDKTGLAIGPDRTIVSGGDMYPDGGVGREVIDRGGESRDVCVIEPLPVGGAIFNNELI